MIVPAQRLAIVHECPAAFSLTLLRIASRYADAIAGFLQGVFLKGKYPRRAIWNRWITMNFIAASAQSTSARIVFKPQNMRKHRKNGLAADFKFPQYPSHTSLFHMAKLQEAVETAGPIVWVGSTLFFANSYKDILCETVNQRNLYALCSKKMTP